MSSGRQPQLWDDLHFLRPHTLFVAGEVDRKFVGLARAMASAVGVKGINGASSESASQWHRSQPSVVCNSAKSNDCLSQSAAFGVNTVSMADESEPAQDQLIGTDQADVGPLHEQQAAADFARRTAVQPQDESQVSAYIASSHTSRQSWVSLPGSGHACHIERPELLLACLLTFMAEL